ncbi:hypothetical protein AAES_12579 [Amazona aestiva]|uniref:Lipase maturation factor n=1 Tax=Amazona aestiva TaxID=12930 RepID=A0A0Q3U5R1_AMAAE|nr:hypothetical protein AAES_12579 [Amazona aestiva]
MTGDDEGLIKIRGDRCWQELTCMDYHYEIFAFVFCVSSVKKEIAAYSSTPLGKEPWFSEGDMVLEQYSLP